MERKPELKPCPFCGATPEIEQHEYSTDILCPNISCPVTDLHVWAADLRLATEKWNTRAEAAHA